MRRRVLSKSLSSEPNATHHYKAPSRRPYKPNIKFEKKVAAAMGHTIRFTDEINGTTVTTAAKCEWDQLVVGSPAQVGIAINQVEKNLAGFGVQDPNVVIGTVDTEKVHVHIHKMIQSVTFLSTSAAIAHVTLYELIPRRDLYGNVSTIQPNYSPKAMITTFNQEGDLLDTGGGQMDYTDVRFTPFMVPLLVQNWKIVNVRKVSVHPGGTLTASISTNNKTVISGIDDQQGLLYKRSTAKILLWKVYGQLGIVTNGAGVNLIRNVPTGLVWKVNNYVEARAGVETRKIYRDYNVSLNNADQGPFTAAQFVNQQTDAAQIDFVLQPTNTS